jgi:hypothetical protein
VKTWRRREELKKTFCVSLLARFLNLFATPCLHRAATAWNSLDLLLISYPFYLSDTFPDDVWASYAQAWTCSHIMAESMDSVTRVASRWRRLLRVCVDVASCILNYVACWQLLPARRLPYAIW